MEIPLEIRVSVFLKEFKQIVTEKRGLDIVDCRENLNSLSELGLTKELCEQEILNLSTENYVDGPKRDVDRQGMIWEFGIKTGSDEIYIKLKIAEVGTEKLAKCISFHKANLPLSFPLKKQ